MLAIGAVADSPVPLRTAACCCAGMLTEPIVDVYLADQGSEIEDILTVQRYRMDQR